MSREKKEFFKTKNIKDNKLSHDEWDYRRKREEDKEREEENCEEETIYKREILRRN